MKKVVKIPSFQITNLVAFCELLVSGAPNLREIVLCTQAEQTALHELWLQLGQLRIDLMLRDVVLKVKCSGTMHDREIRSYFYSNLGAKLDVLNYFINCKSCLFCRFCHGSVRLFQLTHLVFHYDSYLAVDTLSLEE